MVYSEISLDHKKLEARIKCPWTGYIFPLQINMWVQINFIWLTTSKSMYKCKRCWKLQQGCQCFSFKCRVLFSIGFITSQWSNYFSPFPPLSSVQWLKLPVPQSFTPHLIFLALRYRKLTQGTAEYSQPQITFTHIIRNPYHSTLPSTIVATNSKVK